MPLRRPTKLLVSLPLITASAFPQAPAANDLLPPAQRRPAPDFHLTTIAGQPLSLSRFRGHVVLLDFWATTCGGCKVELPWYVAFNQRYHRQGLQLIGLDMYGEAPGLVSAFARQEHLDYPLAIGTDSIGDQFHLQAMPLTVLIDRHGRIAVSHTGIVDRASFEHDLQQLLQE